MSFVSILGIELDSDHNSGEMLSFIPVVLYSYKKPKVDNTIYDIVGGR